MMNNYNSQSFRKNSKLYSQEPDVVGNAPNSESKLRTSWLMSLFFTMLFLAGSNVWAQVSAYTFAQSSGTYTPVTGTSIIAAGSDDTSSSATNIGFNFVYDNATYTQFVANSNGNIRLGASAPTSQYTPISTTGNTASISPFGRDGRGGVITSLSGTAPNRVLTIQYDNYAPNYLDAGTTINMQIKLYETSNLVQFVYGTSVPTTTYAAQVGLRGGTGATDFSNRTNVTSWAASAAGASSSDTATLSTTLAPVSGQTYTWTPPVISTVPNCATALSPANLAVDVARNPTFSWTAATGFPTSYDVYLGTVSPAPFVGNVTGTSYISPSALLANTLYYYKVVAKNAIGDAIGCVEQSFTTNSSLLYCDPVYTSGKTDGDLIANIAISGTSLANNSGAAPVNPAYTYFTGQPNYTATLQAGTSYSVSVTVGTFGNQNVAAWIDYNDNGVFETTERIGFTSASIAGNGTASFNISLACNPPLGLHRMRVRDVYATAGNTINPCATYSWGETEDYDVTISAADPCPMPGNLGVNTITSSSANLTWSVGCAETAWEVAVQLAGSGVPTGSGVSSSTTSYSATGLSIGTAYEFYVRSECSAGVLYSNWFGPFAFTTTDNAPACTTLIAPLDGATNVAIAAGVVQLSWNAPATSPTEGTATSYDVYRGTTSGTLTLIGNVTTTAANVTGILYNQTNYWRIVPRSSGGPAVGPCAEWSFTTEAAPANDLCSGALDLGTLTSPLTASTTGLTNNFTPSCGFSSGNASDAYYSIVVPNGYTLTIGLTASNYDSANTLFYGSCATQNVVVCRDTEIGNETWTNTTGTSQTAYWVQDGWNTGSGIFTLAWSLTPPAVTVTSFTPSQVCGQAGGTSVIITGANFTGATDVQFNGISATSFVVDSYSQITAVLPAGNTNGVVTVYSTPSSNGFGSSASNLIVNAFPTVDPIVGANEICLSSPVLALTSNTALGLWSSSNEAVATVDSAGFVTGLTVGSTVISYTLTDNGCTTAVTHNVDVREQVIITTQPTPVVVVTGNNSSFSVAATGTGLAYQWEVSSDFGASFTALTDDATYSGSTTNTLSITATPSTLNDNEYRCVVSGTSPCSPETSNSAVLNVGNTGIATNPSNVNLCNTGTATFTVVASGDVDGYQWYEDQGVGPVAITNGGDYSGATTATLTIANVTTANNGWTYYVVIDGPANDPQSTSASLNVATFVSIDTQPVSTSVCRAVNTATFSVATSGSVSGIQWQSSANGVTGWTNVGTGASLNVSVTAATPVGVTYYKAVISGTASCPTLDSDVVTLTVTQPTISVTPSSASYCSPGSPVSLTASGASTYSWSPATGLSATTGASVLASPSESTTYTVTGTDASGCVNTTTVTISAGTSIQGTATTNLAEVCENALVQLGIVPSQVVTPYTINTGTYQFAATAGTFTPLVGGTATSLPATADDTLSSAAPIGFTFNFGGTDYTNFRVNSNGLLTFNTTGNAGAGNNLAITTATYRPGIAPLWDDLQCTSGVTYQVSGTAPNRILTVQWLNMEWNWSSNVPGISFQVKLYEGSNDVQLVYNQGPSAGAPAGSGGASIGLMGTVATNYVSLQNATASPTLSTTTSANAISTKPASGQVYTFKRVAPVTYSYAWTSTPAGFTSSLQNPTVNPTVSATYNVVVTSSAGCTVASNVTVNVVSGATIVNQPVALSQCAGTNASFSVTATGPSVTYQWRKNGTPITGNASATTATLNLTAIVEADEASYDVVVTPLCGPIATSSAVTLTVNDIPTAVPTSNSPVCETSTLMLTGTTSNGVTFAWTGPNGFTSTDQNPVITNATVAASGVYNFTATSASGCVFSGSTSVLINSNPVVNVTASNTACLGEIKALTASSTGVGSLVVPFGTNLQSTGVTGGVTFPANIAGLPTGAVITSAQLQFTNVNSINGSWRSEIRVALSGVYTLAATQISTITSGGLIAPDPTVSLTGFPTANGAINLVLTETFNDGGATVDATFGTAQLVLNYTFPTVITWSPTTNLYTDVNATIPYTGTAATTVYTLVNGPATYTATSTTPAGCTRTADAAYTITTSGCPSTVSLVSATCGSTINNLSVTINATYVVGVTGYRFRVTNTVTNAIQIIDRPVNSFVFSSLTGITLNTQYKVEVALKYGTVVQSIYGAPCFVNTPNPVSTIGAQCGTTLTSMSQFVNATYVPNVLGYRFRVTNLVTNQVQITDQGLNKFNFNQLPNRSYNTTYSVEVALKNTDGTYLPYNAPCNITTPLFPTSEVRTSQCDYAALSNTESIVATVISGATQYRFRIYNLALSYDFTVDRTVNTFNLNMFPGLLAGSTYSVQVAVEIGGEFGPYGKVCSLTTPGLARANTPEITKVSDAFIAVAYPNPFAENFMLDIKTASEESIQIRVYDMLGKLVENRKVNVSAITEQEIGASYPSGVYNVIVSQGDQTQTVRVIKR